MSSPAPVVGFVSANRGPVAVALLALGVLCLAASGYCFFKGYGAAAPSAPAEGAPPDVPPPNPFQTEYLGGGLAGLLAAASCIVLGGGHLARLPSADPEKAKRDARWLLLGAGGLFGLAVMFLGLWLLGTWFDVIAKWIGDRDASRAWKPLTALLLFLAGAGLAFAAVQPARTEERNDANLRRLCYGLNFGLSAVLLVVGLVVANVVVGLKLPAELDTTDEGFYSLDPFTQEFLAGLSQDVTVYAIRIGDASDRGEADIVRLLDACRAVNPARFRVRRVADTDTALIAELTEKFKGIDFKTGAGVIVATGPKELPQYSYLTARSMFSSSRSGPRDERLVFQGESQLVNELLYLADNKSKPVVYFTQGSGELLLDAPPGGDAAVRTCGELRTALLKYYIDAKPLVLDPAAPKVPDDAALVVVADPSGPLSAATLSALKGYLAVPGRGGKPGRLLVMAGPPVHLQTRGAIPKTNLNELTSPLGITIEDRLVFSDLIPVFQNQRPLPPEITMLGSTTALRQERNPVALAVPGSGLSAQSPRALQVLPPSGQPGSNRAMPLLGTPAARATWLEPTALDNPFQVWQDLDAVRDNVPPTPLQREKQWGQAFRVVAALATDADSKPKAIVIGFANEFSDELAQALRRGNPYTSLFVASVNWLRDRPPAASVATKTYGEYRPAKPITFPSAFWLPVGGLFVVILFLGLGVWAYRRK